MEHDVMDDVIASKPEVVGAGRIMDQKKPSGRCVKKVKQQDTRISHTVKRLGYSASEVTAAIERLQAADEEITYSSLIDMSYLVQQENLENHVTEKLDSIGWEKEERICSCPDVEVTGDVCTPSGKAGDISDKPSGSRFSGSLQNDEIYQRKLRSAIEKRKMELRSAIEAMTFQCCVCNCSRATILLLPCGHLASCDECLMDVRRCPINRCNKVVRGTKEVYFV